MFGRGSLPYVHPSLSPFLFSYVLTIKQSSASLKKWRGTPFPLYDELADLVEGRLATGAAAFYPAAAHSMSSGTSHNLGDLDDSTIDEDDDDEDSDSDDTAPSSLANTPSSSSRKRSATELDSAVSQPPTKKVRKSKVTAAGAVLQVAGAMRDLGTAFSSSPSSTSDVPSSPSRRTNAIRDLEKSNLLTPRRFIRVVRHIQKNTYVADVFLSLTDNSLRSSYLEAELAEL
jgi:hypothetical protein